MEKNKSETIGNKKLGSGSVILLHNGVKFTPDALELIIVGLEDKIFNEIICKKNNFIYNEIKRIKRIFEFECWKLWTM